MAFCQRAIGSLTVASLSLVVLSRTLGGYPALASGCSMERWWLLRSSILATSIISVSSSEYVSSPLQNISYQRHFPFGSFQRLCTNAVMWKQLRHPNVVSFLGFGSHSPPFSLVYPWIPNGSLSEYLREHPDVDKLGLVCGCSRRSSGVSNDHDPLSIPVIRCRSWVGLPTSTWFGSWELDRGKSWFSRPECETHNPGAQHPY